MARLLDVARELAAAGHGRGLCVSVFLGLDPSTVPTVPALATHVRSLVDGLARDADGLPDSVDHDRRTAARDDVERVAAYLEGGLDRSGAQGVALFVSGPDDVWREVRLPAPVPDSAAIGEAFALAPLLPSLELDRDLILVAVGRERGTIWKRAREGPALLRDLTEPIQSQHRQGGWSQANYERSRDKDASDHLATVADAVAGLVPQGSPALLVVASPPEERPAFEERLPTHVREALLGWASVEAHDDGSALAGEAEQLLERRRRDERRGLVERWQEAAGRGGRAVSGWDQVLTQAWDGSVETLLVDGRSEDAWECPACGRGTAAPGRCPVDETAMERREAGALDLVLRGTLRHGGDVRLLERDDALPEWGGAAALLRYRVPD